MKIFSFAVAVLAVVIMAVSPCRAQTAADDAASLDEALLDEILQDAEPLQEEQLMTEEDMDALLDEAGLVDEEVPSGEVPVGEDIPAAQPANELSTDAQLTEEIPAEEEPVEEAPMTGLGSEEVNIETELIELGLDDALSGTVDMGEETTDLITISLDDVPVQDVVRMFARISGANIVAGTNLVGNVTVNLQDVEWQPALRVILDSVGLSMVEKTDGIYSILSRSDLAAEPVTTETIFLNYTTVTNIIPVIRSMMVSSNASVSGFPSANAVIIQETVERMGPIKETIRRIDRPRSQVFIEAKFVELNDEAIKDIGINWQVLEGYKMGVSGLRWDYQEDRDKLDRRSDTMTQHDTRSQVDILARGYDMYGAQLQDEEITFEEIPGTDPPAYASFTEITPTRTRTDTIDIGRDIRQEMEDTFEKAVSDVRTAVFTADEFALTLSALKQNAGVQVVSNPKILVASGETASIHVGVREPNVRAVPQGDSGDRYAYELDTTNPFIDIGVKVDVTPVVNTESNIAVRITPELSQSLAPLQFAGGLTFPRIQSRRVVTDFSLESGRTVAIGGLIQTGDQEQVKKVPLLGDIPLIGKYLFRHTHTEKMQDEVIIFVTVSMAKADEIREESGIPVEGRLIHKHMIMKRNALREF
ncbi:MAG TPA: secretin N-terminal domain-containing protein [Kiritimatiellia bacterium]|nr:secretin N-terminal domain-containing protein [Kiritimatiellia bacterium]HNR94255.1 secretin N-terminal domain-containing protein [Kiritimatiellia bacterium]